MTTCNRSKTLISFLGCFCIPLLLTIIIVMISLRFILVDWLGQKSEDVLVQMILALGILTINLAIEKWFIHWKRFTNSSRPQ